ncbi:MAG TPA: hypothetical protein VFS66_00400 [Acidimicrobiia bacterium]|nr:hypothetical protein [Acidimicrobiia bacterium]
MAIGRAERRASRRTKVAVLFADRTDRALDLLELLELAWHDVYGDVTPPEEVIDDVLTVSQGTLRGLIRAARLAVADHRDLRLQAAAIRSEL